MGESGERAGVLTGRDGVQTKKRSEVVLGTVVMAVGVEASGRGGDDWMRECGV